MFNDFNLIPVCMVIDFYYVTRRNLCSWLRRRLAGENGKLEKSDANNSCFRWLRILAKNEKRAFCNNLQIHLNELILRCFFHSSSTQNCYCTICYERIEIKINVLFFARAMLPELMRTNRMMALGAVILINLWKSVLLVGGCTRRPEGRLLLRES